MKTFFSTDLNLIDVALDHKSTMSRYNIHDFNDFFVLFFRRAVMYRNIR